MRLNAIKSLIVCLLLGGMTVNAQNGYNDFIPVGPVPIDFKIHDGRLFSEVTIDEENNELVINLLPDELTHKSIVAIDKKENIEYSAIEISEKKHTYIVKTDYIKYTTLPVRKDSDSGEIVGLARVGVGIRIEATIHARAKNITVTDLYSLGEAARNRKLFGHITMSIMGIESEELTARFPVNAEISPTSIQDALQTLVSYQQAIYDKDTHLTPQVLEIKYTSEYRDAATNITDLGMPIILPYNRGAATVIIK